MRAGCLGRESRFLSSLLRTLKSFFCISHSPSPTLAPRPARPAEPATLAVPPPRRGAGFPPPHPWESRAPGEEQVLPLPRRAGELLLLPAGPPRRLRGRREPLPLLPRGTPGLPRGREGRQLPCVCVCVPPRGGGASRRCPPARREALALGGGVRSAGVRLLPCSEGPAMGTGSEPNAEKCRGK